MSNPIDISGASLPVKSILAICTVLVTSLIWINSQFKSYHRELLTAINSVEIRLANRYDNMQSDFVQIRLDTVTKIEMQNLETRVQNLSTSVTILEERYSTLSGRVGALEQRTDPSR